MYGPHHTFFKQTATAQQQGVHNSYCLQTNQKISVASTGRRELAVMNSI
jgi:hypothetical protein